MYRLLVIEDDQHIREELSVLLQHNGYEALSLDTFTNAGEQPLSLSPDLVILDLNLPGIDGHYICRQIREHSNVPIIVVTSRDTDMDELLSMNFGADDFVAKPYNAQVLLARIASVLHRTYGNNDSDNTTSHRGLALNNARCCASFEGREVELTKNQLRILNLLLRNAGSVMPRQRIQEELWQSDEFIDDNTLTVNISHLRQTLASIGAADFIQTKRGIGYVVD